MLLIRSLSIRSFRFSSRLDEITLNEAPLAEANERVKLRVFEEIFRRAARLTFPRYSRSMVIGRCELIRPAGWREWEGGGKGGKKNHRDRICLTVHA